MRSLLLFASLSLTAFTTAFARRFVHEECNTGLYSFEDVEHVFESHRIEWSLFGRDDPWWSVLTDRPRGNALTSAEKKSFYESGSQVVDLHLPKTGFLNNSRAFDFGCGLGRISLALARHFEHVTCVDQSLFHLKKAKAETRAQSEELASKVSFRLSGPNLFEFFKPHTYDFVISFIALQHAVPELQIMYIEQFCRLLVAGGTGYVQIPTFLQQSQETHCGHLDPDFEKEFPLSMQMHYTAISTIEAHLSKAGCKLASSDECDMTGTGTSSCILFKRI